MTVATEPPASSVVHTSRGAGLRVSGVSKYFKTARPWIDIIRRPFQGERQVVLQDVSLDIPPGEFFGLLGPNGAGKTTLFKILSTFILPDEGTVEIGGHDAIRYPNRAKLLLAPVVSDERSLNWRLTAFENLRLYASLQGVRGAQAKELIDEALTRVDLTTTGDKLVGKFSSGMKQRVLIARALLAKPRILLLDEPTRALDPISARRLRRFLKDDLVGKQGCTVLLATHNTEEAIELCDRVGVLDHGRLLRVGSPEMLIREYRDKDYRIWIHSADTVRFSAVMDQRLRLEASFQPSDDPDWTIAQVKLPGGPEATTDLLAAVVNGGVRISRAEPSSLSLADLIERIVQQSKDPK